MPDLHLSIEPRPHIEVRGIYGGMPTSLIGNGKTLADFGINAVWLGSQVVDRITVDGIHAQYARAYAEFNTMHHAAFLSDHPDAAPVGPDGRISPPPDGWQGVCPTHPEYRKHRMDAFYSLLHDNPIDGVWLDYHHSHASWEQAVPTLPDTCFCPRCLRQFQLQTGLDTPVSADELSSEWVTWRCSVFTDWVREFREIRDKVRPQALLGTFHCPWTDTERDGAITRKLAIDLRAQVEHLDVLSIMPYHARFGYSSDIEWINRQTAWLGDYLGITGNGTETKQIWPILQASDWGEKVTAGEIGAVVEAGTRRPATGVMVFNWGSFGSQTDKVAALADVYRAIAGH